MRYEATKTVKLTESRMVVALEGGGNGELLFGRYKWTV